MLLDLSQYQHWTQEELDSLHSLTSYAEAKELGMRRLKRLPQPVAQICGPLTTGGRGSFEKNIQMMHEGIQVLVAMGKIVFDQRPFEIPLAKILRARKSAEYDYGLLNEFYLPLFETGLVKEFHFLPGWESSTGSRWEHEQAIRLNIAIFYMPAHLLLGK